MGKGSRKFQKAKLEFATSLPTGNRSHSVNSILGAVINLEMIEVNRRVCEGHKQRVLSKGLEHPIILASEGVLEPSLPLQTLRDEGVKCQQARGTLQSLWCVAASRPGLGPARKSLATADGQA